MAAPSSQQLRKLADWRTWAALTGDAGWRLRSPCSAPATDEHMRAVRVRWPVRYQHRNARTFAEPLRNAFAAATRLTTDDIPQSYEGVVIAEIDAGEGLRRIAIDYFDQTQVNRECASEVDVYFKMQYRRPGYGDELPHIHPGGYVTGAATLYRNWCRFRRLHRKSQPSPVVFGRFGLRFSADIRSRALELLSSDPRLCFEGGSKQTKLTWYLREMARAGVCTDLPGNGPFCYRLVEAMAMGSCVIGPPHATRPPVDLRSGVEIIHCQEDLSDLADLCAVYTRDPAAADRIGKAAARSFDDNLHPMRLTSYYVRTIQTAGSPGPPLAPPS